MAPRITSALCSAVTLPAGGVPDWVHLLPAGEVGTNDGRGPYRAGDVPALMASSMKSGKLCVDENHATDLAAPHGISAPARGWITELQERISGVWGRVQWTPAGRLLMEAGEYRGISPVIAHRKDGTITAILRASLTNTPNLTGLTSLHSADKKALRSGLSEAERHVISLMGIDAAAYARNRRAQSDGGTISRHTATHIDALSSADLRVISLLGVDRDEYLNRRNRR